MRVFLCALSCLILICCKQKDKKQSANNENKIAIDSTLLTDSTWGPVSASTNFGDLQRIYGSAHIKDDSICGPECADTIAVTKVYPDSTHEFIVYWNDSFYHKKIEMVRCYMAGAPYHSASGIKLGTTLTELLKINGKPISFSGFGWDYGGGVGTFGGGTLESSNLRFTLDVGEGVSEDSLFGDRELNSEMPVVKKFADKIRVSELFMPFK